MTHGIVGTHAPPNEPTRDELADEIDIRIDPQITTADRTVDADEVASFHGIGGHRGNEGAGISVAVMDSGIDDSHPVFDDAGVDIEHHDFTGSRGVDRVGHGTACAGLIAQIAPGVERLYDLRIFGQRGRTGMGPIEQAYRWLFANADSVDLVNMSWGASKRVGALDAMQNRLVSSGVRDVTAAGNTGKRGGSPATAEHAWGVGALTPDGQVTRFSSYNPNRDNPDTSALGKNVKLARAEGTSMGRVLDEEWVVASGTSFAAPIQTGMAACWASTATAGGENGAGDIDGGGESQPVTPTTAMRRFERTAADVPGTPEDGEGRADLEAAQAGTGGAPEPSVRATVWSLLGGPDWIQLDADLFEDGEYAAYPQRLTDALQKQ